MEGYEVNTLEETLATADIFITATGNFNIITVEHMAKMKDKAIVGNIGHFDNEIDMAGLKKVKPASRRVNIKPQYDEFVFPDGHSVLILAEGRLMNLGCATGHPSLRDVRQLHQPGDRPDRPLAQEQAHGGFKYENKVYVLPKKLDEEVARLHLEKLGVKLTKLTKEQATTSASPSKARTSRQRTGTPRVDFPVLATFEACTLPDVDSPRRTVVLHALPRLDA
jgi:adenosylhomocysteinase